MSNVQQRIAGLNKQTLQPRAETISVCRCTEDPCPLQGGREIKDIVYEAKININNVQVGKYFGLTSTKFIRRFSNHMKSFKNVTYRSESTLSKNVWKQKDKGLNPDVTFSLKCKAKSYHPGDKACNLCLREKYSIITHPPGGGLINHRDEIFSRCLHKDRWKVG